MNLRPILKEEYYSLLKKVYIDEMNWQPEKTPNASNIKVENGLLIDDFCDEATYFGFCLNDEPVFGFRLIEGSPELQRYIKPGTLDTVLDNSIEINRLVIDKKVRKSGFIRLIGRVAYDFCKKKKAKYCITTSGNHNLNVKFKKTPMVSIFERAIHYPEGVCNAYAFPINNYLFRLTQSDPFVFGFKRRKILYQVYESLIAGKL
ncbi:MAG: hypothetical protein ACPGXL_06415 [Chitinophagales bacterium]